MTNHTVVAKTSLRSPRIGNLVRRSLATASCLRDSIQRLRISSICRVEWQ